MIELYGTPPTRVVRAQWLLGELDLAHELIAVDLHAGEQSADEIALAKRDGRRMIAVFEQQMQGRDFVVGDRVTVADFNAAFTLDWANAEDLLGDAPALRAYLTSMYARPKAPMTIAESMAALDA